MSDLFILSVFFRKNNVLLEGEHISSNTLRFWEKLIDLLLIIMISLDFEQLIISRLTWIVLKISWAWQNVVFKIWMSLLSWKPINEGQGIVSKGEAEESQSNMHILTKVLGGQIKGDASWKIKIREMGARA